MITQEKLKIFSRYNGDVDMWAKTGGVKVKDVMQSSDWYLIDELIQDLRLIKKGLVSDKFAKKLNERLEENCDNEQTKGQLEKLAEMG